MTATAGCLGSLLSTSATNTVEPEEPTEPRTGSPGEFYYFLESNGINVDELVREDDELFLTYHSEAETVEESNEEIVIIYEVYKQALIHRGSDVVFLYAEVSNPFDEQALGWGIDSDWIHQFDSQTEGDTAGGETTTETAGDETEERVDMNHVMLWNKIMNTKVYREDVESPETDDETNAIIDDDSSTADASNESGDTESDD